jgi:hypothetical protein
VRRKEYGQAEQLLRQAVERLGSALPVDHRYTGIAQVRLGSALAGQERYREAEGHTLAGYKILMKQAVSSAPELRHARQDLIAIYNALDEPAKAEQIRAESVAKTSMAAAAGATE